jgi:hypothetical protein
MKRALALVGVALWCSASAVAQQPAPASQAASGSGAVSATGSEAASFGSFTRLSLSSVGTQGSAVSSGAMPYDGASGGGGDLKTIEFVVEDGLVFVRLGGGTMDLPMPGGGASGCFDADEVARGHTHEHVVRATPPSTPAPPTP